MTSTLDGQAVLVTGGTGSFGKAFVARALRSSCTRVVIYSRDELKQHEMRFTLDDPRLRFFIGDVRDEDRLRLAMQGVHVVVHAAALKQVPACEYNPTEAVATNVIGSENVIMAALRTPTVERVVGLSTDKACLDACAPVWIDHKRRATIRALVGRSDSADVLSMSEDGRITSRRVTAKYKNKRAGRALVGGSYENGPGVTVWMTEDHLLLAEAPNPNIGWLQAWIPAGRAEGRRIVTAERAPTDIQLEFLCGTLLGDASLTKVTGASRPCLTVSHCTAQREWLGIKHSILADWMPHISGSASRQAAVRTTSGATWAELRQAFYPHGVKVVPRALIARHLTDRLLATWYLDDGCRDAKANLARLATHGFTHEDAMWLAETLTARGFDCHVLRVRVSGKEYSEIRFSAPGSRRLFEVIGRFVPPSMRHKVPEWARTYDAAMWDLGGSQPYIARAHVVAAPSSPEGGRRNQRSAATGRFQCKRGDTWGPMGETACARCGLSRKKHNGHGLCGTCYGSLRRRDVFCLDIEDTHNFIAGGLVVHNCQPVTLYGSTKLVAERLFIAANSFASGGRPRFAATRYGNVAGSRGSVIPLFKMLAGRGEPLPVTHPEMTRFYMTLDESVDLVLLALREMRGGEVFIPKLPAFRVLDLADALHAPYTLTGIRAGEKVHESLISPDEMRSARDYGDHYRLLPTHHPWCSAGYVGGVPCDKAYTSDGVRLLSARELEERIA